MKTPATIPPEKKKRKKPFRANLASEKMMEAAGWIVGDLEKWIPATPLGYKGPLIKRDLFNFADLLCARPGKGIMLVQVTAGSHLQERIDKVKADWRHKVWLKSGGLLQVHSWVKRAGQTQRECKIVEIRAGRR